MTSIEKMTSSGIRYTIDDFNNIAENGFEYRISEATLDIISALSAQVGAPDYIKTPNFNSGTGMRHGGRIVNNYNDVKNRGHRGHNGYVNDYGMDGGRGHGRRGRRKHSSQEMNDDEWEDLRSFHANPKTELSPEKAMEKRLRGELNRVVVGCSRSQIKSIADIIHEMCAQDMGNIAAKVFFNIATCSKINTGLFAELFCELVDNDDYDDEMFMFMSERLKFFISDGEKWGWMEKYGKIEYINEDEDYDRFCDVNKVNDKRLNVSRFVGKLFQNMFEKEDDRFFMMTQLSRCYKQMYDGFIQALEKDDNEDVSMIYCANIIEFMNPIIDYVEDLDSSYEDWDNVNEQINKIIDEGQDVYPSLSRQIVFALQGSNLV
jgi:hypothetical protein